jgi:hypothetical protein
MKIFELRRDARFVQSWAEELRTNKLLQLVMDTLEHDHPARYSVNGDNNDDISPTRASIELGVTRGYSMYADRLRLLATPFVGGQGMPETTYLPPDVPEKKKK